VTRVVPRVEKVFREKRDAKIAAIKNKSTSQRRVEVTQQLPLQKLV